MGSRSVVAVCGFLGALSSVPAAAQGIETHRPIVPSAGIATENGPGAMWINPANLAYDPDPRYGVFFGRDPDAQITSIGAIAGVDGLSVGLHNRLRPDLDDPSEMRSDWSLDYGSSISLPQRLSVGLLLSWNFVEAGPNYLAYDAGFAFRPLPWLGVGAIAQNVGSPDPLGVARPRVGAGIGLRPFGRAVLLGLDAARTGLRPPSEDAEPVHYDVATASLRLRPLEGLYLRGNARARLDDGEVVFDGFGAGLEIYFGGAGAVGHLDFSAAGSMVQAGWVGTDEPGESLVRSGRRVPVLSLDDEPPYQPRTGLFADDDASWLETLERLRRLEDDRGVRGVVLSLEGVSMSLARFGELRARIEALEASGKPVLVYLSRGAGNGSLYAASAASRVALHPGADLSFVGLSVELTHFRGLLDLVGVQPDYVRQGKYKTGPEAFTHPEPSQANLEMTEALLDSLFGEMVERVAEGREVDERTVRAWVDHGPMTADEAIDKGVVDVLLYPDELDDELRRMHDGQVTTGNLLDLPQPRSPWEDPKQIAVIYVEGPITSGESRSGALLAGRSAGERTIRRKLRRARTDRQVRGVVLRVDSPGGSALAADGIAREVARLKRSGKPVIASFGGTAASGGYYVAAAADAILAEPTTLTGSIGVYSGKFATSELQEALGVSTTSLSRGRHASIYSLSRPWDDVQRARMQALVDHTYDRFKEHVAEGRGLEPAQVEELARGRVWTGRAAHEQGLVTQIGGLHDAILKARARAGIPARAKVSLVEYSERGSVLESLAPDLLIRAASPWARKLRAAQAPEGLEQLLHPVRALATPLLHPEERVWMMTPWSLTVTPD